MQWAVGTLDDTVDQELDALAVDMRARFVLSTGIKVLAAFEQVDKLLVHERRARALEVQTPVRSPASPGAFLRVQILQDGKKNFPAPVRASAGGLQSTISWRS